MRTDNPKFTYQIFKDLFEGEYSREESTDLLALMSHPDNSAKFERYLHELWKEKEGDIKTSKTDLSHILDRVHHEIKLEESRNLKERSFRIQKRQPGSLRKVMLFLGKAAAVLLVPLLVFNGVEWYNHRNWIENQSEVVYNEIQCPMGARSQFVLPDGTRGSLNNGSTLKYPVKFTGIQREVELNGEAFFDVAHSKRMPFIVKTAALDVKVRGTRVNVYSYPDESYQEVTLESGSVELIQNSGDQEVVIAKLKPGQHMHYDYGEQADLSLSGENNVTITDKIAEEAQNSGARKVNMTRLEGGELYMLEDESDRYTGWTEGKLILRNDPMPILLRRVERWYSVKFNILDQRIYDYTYRATFEEENLDQVLKLLALTGPLEFTKVPRKQSSDGTYNVQEINVTIKKTN